MLTVFGAARVSFVVRRAKSRNNEYLLVTEIHPGVARPIADSENGCMVRVRPQHVQTLANLDVVHRFDRALHYISYSSCPLAGSRV